MHLLFYTLFRGLINIDIILVIDQHGPLARVKGPRARGGVCEGWRRKSIIGQSGMSPMPVHQIMLRKHDLIWISGNVMKLHIIEDPFFVCRKP